MTNKELKDTILKEAERLFDRAEKRTRESMQDRYSPVIMELAVMGMKHILRNVTEVLHEMPNSLRIIVLEQLLEFSYFVEKIRKETGKDD